MKRLFLAVAALLLAFAATPLAVRSANASPAQIGAVATPAAPMVQRAQYYHRGYRPYRRFYGPRYGYRRHFGPRFYGRGFYGPRYGYRRHYWHRRYW
jgi:hypothetical protein